MSDTTDIAIIGAGILGLYSAVLLGRAGREVTVFEREAPFRAASGANAGGLSIQAAPAYILDGTIRSVKRWASLADVLGESIGYNRIGGLRLATTQDDVGRLKDSAELLRSKGLEIQWLEGEELRSDHSWLGQGVLAATYCPDEGYASPLLMGRALQFAARAAGVVIRQATTVRAIHAGSPQTELDLGAEKFTARTVLIAAGAWNRDLAAMVGLDLPVKLRPLMLTVTERTSPLIPHIITHAQRKITLKQVQNGTCLIGGGWPGTGSLEPYRKHVESQVLCENLKHAVTAVPGLASVAIARSWVGLDGGTPDELPLLGRLREDADIHILGNAKGGFVRGPMLAESMVGMLLGSGPSAVDAYSPKRFQLRTMEAARAYG